MKKILVIDARMVGPFGHGIAKYVEGIAKTLKDGEGLTDILVKTVGAKALADLEVIFLVAEETPPSSPVFQYKTVKMQASPYHPKSWMEVPKVLKALHADLFFNPTFASYPYLPCKFVQVVHDLNHLHFGSFAQKLYYRTLLKTSIRQAEWVFTVSNAVRKELVDWTKTDPHKIKVFYNHFDQALAIHPEVANAILAKHGLKTKHYFLCVTNEKPHKNTEMLINAHGSYFRGEKAKNGVEQAWSQAFSENAQEVDTSGKTLPLVLTLPPSTSANEPGIIRVGNVNDETLGVLLQNTAGFYFPSLYEGFGRPPVEASLNGVKFIAVSDITVHHEVQGFSDIPFHFLQVHS